MDDWKKPENYKKYLKLTYRQFVWELLRRNPEYISSWVSYTKTATALIALRDTTLEELLLRSRARLTKTISLVVDTNLFFEGKVLKEIAWNELGHDEVELLITQPVQNEIDKHKKNPAGRTYKRALKYSSLLRDMVINKRLETIKDSAPRITLDCARGVYTRRWQRYYTV